MSNMLIPGENLIGVYRRSAFTPEFWLWLILSLGLYYVTLWRRNQIVLTDRRVMQRTGGLISGREVSISLENVSDVDLFTTTLGALFGFGNIAVEAVNSQRPEIVFEGLSHAKQLRDEIFALQARTRQQSGQGAVQPQPLRRPLRP